MAGGDFKARSVCANPFPGAVRHSEPRHEGAASTEGFKSIGAGGKCRKAAAQPGSGNRTGGADGARVLKRRDINKIGFSSLFISNSCVAGYPAEHT